MNKNLKSEKSVEFLFDIFQKSISYIFDEYVFNILIFIKNISALKLILRKIMKQEI